ILCVPTRRVAALMAAPVPSAPSRLELQRILALRSPSSLSEAVAARPSGSRLANSTVPSVGVVIRTTGGWFTTRSIWATALAPLGAVTRPVVVWVPALSAGAGIVAPGPRGPARVREPRVYALPEPA